MLYQKGHKKLQFLPWTSQLSLRKEVDQRLDEINKLVEAIPCWDSGGCCCWCISQVSHIFIGIHGHLWESIGILGIGMPNWTLENLVGRFQSCSISCPGTIKQFHSFMWGWLKSWNHQPVIFSTFATARQFGFEWKTVRNGNKGDAICSWGGCRTATCWSAMMKYG